MLSLLRWSLNTERIDGDRLCLPFFPSGILNSAPNLFSMDFERVSELFWAYIVPQPIIIKAIDSNNDCSFIKGKKIL